MPYCPDCGVRSENGAPACSSCGLVFSPEPESKEPEFEMSDDHSPVVLPDSKNRLPSMAQTSVDEEHSSYIMRDTQLGKGTIKPFSVELGVDGYHFKFEEPPRRMSRMESSKEKNVQFRMTEADNDRLAQAFADFQDKADNIADVHGQPDMIDQTVTEIVDDQTGQEETNVKSPEMDNSEMVMSLETPPCVVEEGVSVEPTSTDIQDIAEISAMELPGGHETINEEKPISIDEDVLPIEGEEKNATVDLPAGRTDEDGIKIIWKGNRNFLGIPLSEQYQVTNRSIIVDTPKTGRHFEYSLMAVVTLSVKQTWLDKILGAGNLTVKVRAGSDMIEVVLRGIANPMNVLRTVADLIGSRYNRNYES